MRLVRPGVSHARKSSRLWRRSRSSRLVNERGQALLETAITLPIVLLVAVAIFEFGRAYQTVQVITNAAREGARVAVLPQSTNADVLARVVAYLRAGQLPEANRTTVAVNRNGTVSIGGTGTASASTVDVSYPFRFMVLNSVANLVRPGSTMGDPFTMTISAQMRNEAQ
jgi:Flp pilus assembly protein TadG